jgi:hypothetical protein
MSIDTAIRIALAAPALIFFQLHFAQQTLASKQSSTLAERQESVAAPLESGEPEANLPHLWRKCSAAIKFETDAYDFGKVNPGREYCCEFKFRNIGEDVLRIEKITSTCGCTVPKLTKKEYGRGESGSIGVTFLSPERPGPAAEHIYVHSKRKENGPLKLTIKANVEFNIIVEPKKLNLSLKEKDAGITPIVIRSKDGRPFSVENFAATNGVITADFDPSVKAAQLILKPQVDTDKLRDCLNGIVGIKLTHPDINNVYVSYTAKPLFEISRSFLVIRNSKHGEPITRKLWVKSNYGDPVEVEYVSSSNKHTRVLRQWRGHDSIALAIEITPPVQVGRSMYFRDDLRIGIKNGDELVVRCCGFYARPLSHPHNRQTMPDVTDYNESDKHIVGGIHSTGKPGS